MVDLSRARISPGSADEISPMNNNDSKPRIGGVRKGRRKTALTGGRSTLLNEEDALAKVTWLYYHRKLTQQQIAEELGISRPTVIRLLRQASESGLVTVSLRLDILRRMDIAQEMAQRFGLKEVFIVPTSKRDTESDVIRAVGRTGALYLETNIKPDQILTICWGRMMYEVASALTEKPVSGLVVAQSFGGLNSGESFNPSRVTSLVGEKLHARVYHLYVPAMVATRELRDVLLADSGIHAALEVARHASIFMAGIGKVENTATILETGFFDISTIDRLRARGAVGDISGRYFDIHGKRILGDIEDRIIGLTWEDLERLENVAAVACGQDKTQAILGALRTGILDYLIIDDRTALEVMNSDGPSRQPLNEAH
jgi:DNA-binding transcriptional regulator LsrR (DeoR family)